jgi:hypothetical protein
VTIRARSLGGGVELETVRRGFASKRPEISLLRKEVEQDRFQSEVIEKIRQQ